jgi:hypothetical protein
MTPADEDNIVQVIAAKPITTAQEIAGKLNIKNSINYN